MAEGDAQTWYAGLDAEHQSMLQSRGLHTMDPAQAAVELAKAYRGSERLRGGLAAGDVVALPRGPDHPQGAATPEELKAFWQRVGAPADASGYKFDDLKFSDGTSPDQSFQDQVRAAAAASNMPAHMLNSFMKQMLPHMEAEEANSNVAAQAAATASRQALDAEWGVNAMRNKFVAGRAADMLQAASGVDVTAAMDELQKSPGVGYAGVMKMLKAIGEMAGEGRFVPSGGQQGAMTKEQAQERLSSLGKDQGWLRRWAAGGSDEAKLKTDLIRIINGTG